jgi:hypothetical protein
MSNGNSLRARKTRVCGMTFSAEYVRGERHHADTKEGGVHTEELRVRRRSEYLGTFRTCINVK